MEFEKRALIGVNNCLMISRKKCLAWCLETEKLEEIKIRKNCLLGYISSRVKGIKLPLCEASPNAYGSVTIFRYQDNCGNIRA